MNWEITMFRNVLAHRIRKWRLAKAILGEEDVVEKYYRDIRATKLRLTPERLLLRMKSTGAGVSKRLLNTF